MQLPSQCASLPAKISRCVVALALALAAAPVCAREDSESELAQQLGSALAKKNFDGASRIIEQLLLVGSAEAMEVICDHAFSANDADMERYTIDKLVDLPTDGPAVAKLSEIANRHKDFRVRVALMFALCMRSEPVAVTALFQGLYDPMMAVARASLDSIKKRDSVLSVDALIDALAQQEQQGKSTDTLHFEIRAVLTYLTGESLEASLDWRNFWSMRKDNFQRPAADKRKESKTYVRKDAPVFFGHEVSSKKLLFVLDISESMKKKDPLPEESGEPGKPGSDTGRTSVAKNGKTPKETPPEPPKQEDIPESRQRLARLQKELVGVIEKLPSDTHFDIVIFNNTVELFRPELFDASKINKQRAIEFVRNLRPSGDTHTDEALDKAFEFRDIDSIFLLSDGAPRKDNVLLETAPIVAKVRDTNRFRRIRIFTVGFEQMGKSLRDFMKALAYQNNGSYRGLR